MKAILTGFLAIGFLALPFLVSSQKLQLNDLGYFETRDSGQPVLSMRKVCEYDLSTRKGEILSINKLRFSYSDMRPLNQINYL